MKSTFNYTSRAVHAISQQLQHNWLIMLIVLAAFLFSGNVQAQDKSDFCDGDPAEWPGLVNNGTANADLSDAFNSDSDTQFTQGSKDENELSENHWNRGLVNDKGDIINAGAKLVDGCYLRFFADRYAVNGDAAIGFWFYQDPNVSLNSDGSFSGVHMDGDILVIVNFEQGGGTSDPIIYQWEGDGVVLVDEDVEACGITNTTEMNVPSGFEYTSKFGPAGKYEAGAFFEGYINLCDIEGVDICFSKFLVETRNSQSLDASLQDLAFGDIDISPAQPLATATDITCIEEESTITVDDPIIGYTYILDGPGIGDPIEITPTAANPDVEFTAGEPGTYTLIVENESGCQSEPYEVDVDADLTPIGIPGVGDEERCGPGTVTFEISAPLNGVTYRWYDEDDDDAEPVGTGTSFTTNNLSSTTSFWVTATGANGCESTRTEVQALIFTPVTTNAGTDLSSCGASPVQLNGSVTGGATTGSWTGGTGTFNPSRNVLNPIYTPSAAEVDAGSVTLTLTSADPTGPCLAVSDAITITITDEVAVDAGSDVDVCSSSPNVTLAGSISGGATTGAWTGGTGTFNPNRQTLNAVYTPSAAEIAAGTVTLTLESTDPEGPCEGDEDEVTITIYPAVTVDAGGPDTRCESATAQVIPLTGASITGGATTGTWSIVSSVPASAGNMLTNTTSANGSLTVAAGYVGTITLRLTSADPTGPCGAITDDRIVTIGPAAVVDAGGPDTRCQSATSQAIALTGASVTGGASTGTWSIVSSVPANAGNMLSNTTLANGSLTIAANYYGVITLRLTSADPDGNGPCQAATDDRIVTINQNPTVDVTAAPSTCVNNVPTVLITAAASGGSGTGYVYDWTVPQGATDPGNVASFSATVAGTYSVVVTDSRQCSGSDSVVPVFTPCEELEGCTPGYWKQSQHFGNWGCNYEPTGSNATEFFEVFTGITNTRGLDEDMTLLEALEQKGGKFQALARHAAAAILNACADVNYKYTDAEIIGMVRTAFNTGNWSTAHNNLSAANEMGCPLGRAELSATSSSALEGIKSDQMKAYPTPFSDKARIEFTTSRTENFVVNLYDMKGGLVKQLKAGTAKAGELQVVEVDGKGLNEGLYIARMISDSGARSVKLLLKRE